MSKRIGNIKRLLVAMGISFISMCTLGQIANAQLSGKIVHYRTANLTDKIRYELNLAESDINYKLEELSYFDGTNWVAIPDTNNNTAKITAGKETVDGEQSVESLVVEVPDTARKFRITNDKTGTPDEKIIFITSNEGAAAPTIGDTAPNIGKITNFAGDDCAENSAPVLSWAYRNTEGNYVQFEASDDVVIDRILDKEGKDRVIIQEKDKETEITAKYKLKTGSEIGGTDTDITQEEDVFYVLDRLGNALAVDISRDALVQYTLAAKDIEGSTVVLNMTLPTGATLNSIKTVEGTDLTTNKKADNTDAGIVEDYRITPNTHLVSIYTQVPVGTTYVNVEYTPSGASESITIPVELDLDLTAPEVVRRNVTIAETEQGSGVYNVTGTGEITTQQGGHMRVYKNSDSSLAIVEVTDMVSGIKRIAACTGTGNGITEAEVESGNPAEATNQAFDIQGLPTSIVQLMSLPDDATYIRVYDGIGNMLSIDLSDVDVISGNSETPGNAGLTLTLAEDAEGVVHATYQSKTVGMWKFVKAKDETEAKEKEVTSPTKTSDGDQEYRQTHANEYETIQTTANIAKYYPTTEQNDATISGAQLQGEPHYVVVDAFGNTEIANLNDILFKGNDDNHYVYKDDNGTSGGATAIAVKVHEPRRIKKITATIDGQEKTLETFEVTDTPLANDAQGAIGPVDLDRVYEIGNGATVTDVTVHHWTKENDNVTQNVVAAVAVTAADKSAMKYGANNIDVISVAKATGAEDKFVATIRYGIKRIDYSDDTVLEFYDEIPKKVEIQAPLATPETEVGANDAVDSWVRVTDALGYTYKCTVQATQDGGNITYAGTVVAEQPAQHPAQDPPP